MKKTSSDIMSMMYSLYNAQGSKFQTLFAKERNRTGSGIYIPRTNQRQRRLNNRRTNKF